MSTFEIILAIAVIVILFRIFFQKKTGNEEDVRNDPEFPEKWKKLLPEEKTTPKNLIDAFKEGYREGKNKETE